LAWKHLFFPKKLGFWGIWSPRWSVISLPSPKLTSCFGSSTYDIKITDDWMIPSAACYTVSRESRYFSMTPKTQLPLPWEGSRGPPNNGSMLCHPKSTTYWLNTYGCQVLQLLAQWPGTLYRFYTPPNNQYRLFQTFSVLVTYLYRTGFYVLSYGSVSDSYYFCDNMTAEYKKWQHFITVSSLVTNLSSYISVMVFHLFHQMNDIKTA